MSQIKVWPHMTIVAVLVAIVAGLGVAFYLKHEQNTQAAAIPNAARIQRVDGEVALSNSLDPATQNNDANTQWTAATVNQPFSVGDRIYTRDNAHSSLAFTGRNFARLNPNTELDVLDLSDNRTQLALRDGSAIFDVGYLNPGELFEVGTPYGAVDFDQPGLYNVGLDNNNGSVLVSVLSGLAQVVGLGGSGRIDKGEILTLAGTTAAQALLGRLNGNDAGYLVDDYYRDQYPNYDGRYNNYDAYLNDPYYYDPYRNDPSYQYAPAIIPGLNDLAYYGDWQNVDGYGYAWRPRVDSAWVPYQQGYWATDYPYGPTWVSSEPWGYAPYHYGRWANVGNQWFWVPDSVNTTPVYSPALVAFLPLSDANQMAWVPLGPGDAYAPRYYDANWQPYYLSNTNLAPTQLVNMVVPNAVTVVPVDYYGRTIDPRVVTRIDRQAVAQLRPTLEPLTLTPLKNAVIHSAWGRGKIDLPPGIAKKLNDTRVFVGATPPASRFGRDMAKNLRVDAVPDKVKSQKWNVKDERQNGIAQAPGRQNGQNVGQANNPQIDAAHKQQQAALAAEAAKGNKDARHQLQQLEQQERKQGAEQQQAQRHAEQQAQQDQRRVAQQAQQEQRRAAQQAQGARVRQPAAAQPEREIMRPQRPQVEPRRAAPAQPRLERPQPRPEPARQAAPQPRPQPQPHQEVQRHAPSQERLGPPQKAEAKHGPPAQPAAQGQGQPGGGGGKGKGKKP